jgi:hypothetical protein
MGSYLGQAYIAQFISYIIIIMTPGLPIYASIKTVDSVRTGL